MNFLFFANKVSQTLDRYQRSREKTNQFKCLRTRVLLESGKTSFSLLLSSFRQAYFQAFCNVPWILTIKFWFRDSIVIFVIIYSLVQAETHDGIPSNQTGDVIHKNDKEYGFVCLNKDQAHGLCRNYRVRFLCGKLGTFITYCQWLCCWQVCMSVSPCMLFSHFYSTLMLLVHYVTIQQWLIMSQGHHW